MAVDKDLFGGDARVYSPDNCCILPQTLNTLLVNGKKRYCSEKSLENKLPFGVHYSIQQIRQYVYQTMIHRKKRLKNIR